MKKKIKETSYQLKTSKYDYEKIGIHLTDEQYADIQTLNLLLSCDDMEHHAPIHYILMLLKVLGLPDTPYDKNNTVGKNYYEKLEEDFNIYRK